MYYQVSAYFFLYVKKLIPQKISVIPRFLPILRISLTKVLASYIVRPTIVFLVVNQKIYVSPGITPGLFLLEHRKKVYIEL